MESFADVALARTSYQTFVDALSAGRDILRRAGVPDPPPIPEFDAVFRRLGPDLRQELYMTLAEKGPLGAADTIGLWQSLIKRTFAQPRN